MENSKNLEQHDYMKVLPWFALGASCHGFLSIVAMPFIEKYFGVYRISYGEMDESKKLLQTIIGFIPNVLFTGFFWFCIGKVSGKMNFAMSAVSVNITLLVLISFLYFKKTMDFDNDFSAVLDFCILFIPYFVFAWQCFGDKRAIILGLLGLSITGFHFVYNGYMNGLLPKLDFENFYHEEINVTKLVPMLLIQVLSDILHFMVFCEVFKVLANSPYKFIDKLLNFSNNRSRGQVILVFLSTRIVVFIALLGILNFLEFLTDHNEGEKSYLRFGLYFLSSLSFIYFTSWLYRKVITEFLFSYEKSPSWTVWFTGIPIIGDLLFIMNVLNMDKKVTIQERIAAFSVASEKNEYQAIRVLILFFASLAFFFQIMINTKTIGQNSTDSIYFGCVLGFTLLIIYLFTAAGLHINIVMFVFIFALAFIPTFHKYVPLSVGLILVFSIVRDYTNYSIFHIHEFVYLPSEENADEPKPIEDNFSIEDHLIG